MNGDKMQDNFEKWVEEFFDLEDSNIKESRCVDEEGAEGYYTGISESDNVINMGWLAWQAALQGEAK